MSSKSSEFYFIGLSMASNSAHSSSVCVINKNKEIVLIDKLYFTDDIKLFFESSPYVRNSILMVGLSLDESLLDGKWRIHSKNYKIALDRMPLLPFESVLPRHPGKSPLNQNTHGSANL